MNEKITSGQALSQTVYILSNPAMPELVKIGLTERTDPLLRMRELFSTGVPLPFKCEAAWIVDNAVDAERSLHRIFAAERVSRAREFFRVEVKVAVSALAEIGLCDITAEVNERLEQANEREFRRPVQDWLEMGYSPGDTFQAGETGEIVTVIDGRLISYQGEAMSLSAARKIIREKCPHLPYSCSFHCNGEPVNTRYEDTYGPAKLE